MTRRYEIEATFIGYDEEETADYIEQRLRSFGCTDVFVTSDEAAEAAEAKPHHGRPAGGAE